MGGCLCVDGIVLGAHKEILGSGLAPQRTAHYAPHRRYGALDAQPVPDARKVDRRVHLRMHRLARVAERCRMRVRRAARRVIARHRVERYERWTEHRRHCCPSQIFHLFL